MGSRRRSGPGFLAPSGEAPPGFPGGFEGFGQWTSFNRSDYIKIASNRIGNEIVLRELPGLDFLKKGACFSSRLAGFVR